jgi:hypothetical protein
LIGRQQPVDHRLLVLLDAPNACERQLQRLIHAGARVAEAIGFRFDSVHQNDADTREGVVVELANRCLHEIAPGEDLTVERRPLLAKNIH